MAFVKIHGTILDSSVWSESHATRIVWITMLAMADENGVVGASVGGLGRRAVVNRGECEDALEILLSSDPDSRDGTDGQRIEKVPGGWLILNHGNYRDRRTKAQIQTAERVRRHRAKDKAERDAVTGNEVTEDLPTSPPDTEGEAEGEPDPDPETRPPATSTPIVGGGEGPGYPGGVAQVVSRTVVEERSMSGVLHAIDEVRRQVEAETREKIGGLTQRPDKLDGLAAAVDEYGLPRVLEVVYFRCEQVATGEVVPQLWRRLFSGDGFHAAEEQLRKSDKAVQNARELLAERKSEPVADDTERQHIGDLAEVVTFPRPRD